MRARPLPRLSFVVTLGPAVLGRLQVRDAGVRTACPAQASEALEQLRFDQAVARELAGDIC